MTCRVAAPAAVAPSGWPDSDGSSCIVHTGSQNFDGERVEEARTVLENYLLHGGAEEELSWQERALCAQTDPEAFFPEKGGSTREAKRVCLECEVRDECLSYALAHDERFGIWGGLSERERRRLKRRAAS
jgi:WhiB family transcriptional regulator, redox-sensing transcriptional regulator